MGPERRCYAPTSSSPMEISDEMQGGNRGSGNEDADAIGHLC